MPEKILELLETCSLTKDQIAKKINVTIEELDAAMEYLQQMGFIKSTAITPTNRGCSNNCGGNCGKCSGSCNTSSNSGYTVWELT